VEKKFTLKILPRLSLAKAYLQVCVRKIVKNEDNKPSWINQKLMDIAAKLKVTNEMNAVQSAPTQQFLNLMTLKKWTMKNKFLLFNFLLLSLDNQK
jgi:hypothetical protein